MRLLSPKFLFLLLVFGCWHCLSAQYNIPKKPDILYPIYDEVGILSSSEKEELNRKLIAFEDSTSTEIEVIVIPTTKGEDINFLATKFGQQWKIGKKNVDNGVVFLIATEDRKMAIQQGRSVEQYLTASVAGQILDYIVTPHFRKGNYYEGIHQGTSAIMEALQGKFTPQKKKNSEDGLSFKNIIILFIIFVIFIILISKNDNDNYHNDDDDDVILSRRGKRKYSGGFFPFPGSFGSGSSRGGFGGSSGGFGGFGGGGSFGGGGASGGW